MHEYRVQLDIFHGPMDLLLYLVRKNEVQITDIPIALIAGQYLQYVTLLKEIDPESAAEFLVLAATLMEIKSRCLLPVETAAEGAESSVTELTDPRGELIRQLLEYKDFKDRAMLLDRRFDETAQRFARVPAELERGGEASAVDLSEIGVWELLCAFERIMSQVQVTSDHQVVDDDTPLELYAAEIQELLAREGPLPFEMLFEGRTRKTEVIGLFLAVLQLIKDRQIHAVRASESCGIVLALLAEAETEAPPASAAPTGGTPTSKESASFGESAPGDDSAITTESAPATESGPEADSTPPMKAAPTDDPMTPANPAATSEPANPGETPLATAEPTPKKRRPWRRPGEGNMIELEPIVQPDPAIANADQVLANFSLHPPKCAADTR